MIWIVLFLLWASPNWLILLSWAPPIISGAAWLSISFSNRKTYRLVCERIDAYAEEVDGIRENFKELNSLKYRMDIFEGKHLRARNLGIGGLPQPRPRDKNGD